MTHCDMGPEAAERYVAGDDARAGADELRRALLRCERLLPHGAVPRRRARSVLAGGPFTAERTKAGGVTGRGLPLQMDGGRSDARRCRGTERDDPPRVEPRPSPSRRRRSKHPRLKAPASISPPPAPAVAAPAPSAPAASARQTSEGRLERWAAVIPPQYVALTTRSGQDPDAEEDTRTLRRGDDPLLGRPPSRGRRRPPGPGGPHTGRGARAVLPRHLGVDGPTT